MAEQLTVSDLLAAQTERKLNKMRSGIISEMERLGSELKLVEEALARKQRGKRQEATVEVREERQPRPSVQVSKSASDGRFEGLSRDELYEYVVEVGGGPVRPADMRNFLMHKKGIVRTTEAVRVSLVRLARDHRLIKLSDGRFAVPNGNGTKPDSERPAPSGDLPGFEAAEVTASADSSADVRSN